MVNWDDNNWEENKESDLRYFYEEFSASVRRQLISKNLLVPQNVYDVLYSQKKEELLAKNVVKISDLEESSKSIRDALIVKLISNNIDLEKISEDTRNSLLARNKIIQEANDLLNLSFPYRESLLLKNVIDGGDLLNDSNTIRRGNISKNVSAAKNIDINNEEYRINNLSKNIQDVGDLLADSKEFLNNNVSANVINSGDLLIDSKEFLNNNISANEFLNNNVSANSPNAGDLLIDSKEFLNNNISSNITDVSDLLVDSKEFLNNNVSSNKPGDEDLLTDSKEFLNNNLSTNILSSGDLATDSTSFLSNNVSLNVPNPGDLATDSTPFLSNNVSLNVPNPGDLATDSTPFLINNLAPNVPNPEDLLTDSAPFLINNLAPNVPNPEDLLTDSAPFLINNLIPNVPSLYDVDNFINPAGIADSAVSEKNALLAYNTPSVYNINNFITPAGIGNNATSEKNNLLAKNIQNHFDVLSYSNAFRIKNLSKNPPSNQLGVVVEGIGTSSFIGLSRVFVQGKILSKLLLSRNKYKIKKNEYTRNNSNLENLLTKGNSLDLLTENIRNYNLSRNTYNLNSRIEVGNAKYYQNLKDINTDGFQELIATLGTFNSNPVSLQKRSNLLSEGNGNGDGYLGRNINIIGAFKPDVLAGVLGVESMMAQTVAGNPLMDKEFKAGTKGVRHIMKTIRDSYKGGDSDITQNYNVQGKKDTKGRKFVIGIGGGETKVVTQRYSIANPYSPGPAKTLLFSIKNYSSDQNFYFPPYIQSYSDSYGANWNSINFLGRPEPVFTYNNSTREGTISFVVLTDFTQNIVIGKDYSKDSMEDIKIDTKRSAQFARNTIKDNTIGKLDKDIKDKSEEVQSYKQKEQEVQGTGESTKRNSDTLGELASIVQKELVELEKTKQNLIKNDTTGVYSESSSVIGNVNNFMIDNPGNDGESEIIDTKAADSKSRIDEMIKNLAFQPAFFSGDKVDFQTKIDFLAKLTRPATASKNSGFSFSTPPVCHIHLGDWWNNDIVVDSVAFNYDDAPWTLDDNNGRVQPMWAVVTMTFKFVGPYGGHSGDGGPVLSDQKGGLYWDRDETASDKKTH